MSTRRTGRRPRRFAIVSGEYNHGIPPGLKNLLDHFLEEYFFRPSAIVCYSAGQFGGVRAAMQLRAECGLFVAHAHWQALADADGLAPAGASVPDWHAGWIETSVMLQLRPDLVAMDRAAAGPWRHPNGLPPSGPASWAWMTGDLSANGVIGDPRQASAALGARLIERAVEGLTALVEKMAAAPWPENAGGSGGR